MKANQLATLVLRLIGIYCLTQVIPVVSSFIALMSFASANINNSQIIYYALASFLLTCWFGGCVLLVVRAEQWGAKLTPKDIGDDGLTVVSFEQVQVITFAVAGVLIFAEALPQLFTSVSSLINSLNQIADKDVYPPRSQVNNWRTLLSAIGVFAKAALGLWMFLGARGFTNFWRSFRTFGTPKPPQS